MPTDTFEFIRRIARLETEGEREARGADRLEQEMVAELNAVIATARTLLE